MVFLRRYYNRSDARGGLFAQAGNAHFTFTGAICGSNLLTNPSFEAGLSGWTVTNQPGSSGSWFAQTGTVSPMSGFTVPAPPDGTTAAMTDQSGEDRTLCCSPSRCRVRHLRSFSALCYFVETALAHTLHRALSTSRDLPTSRRGWTSSLPGDRLVDTGYNPYTFNITSQVGAGGTFQLRFAEADNQLFFQLGVDRVSVDFTAVLEPGTATLLLGGLLTVLGIRGAAALLI
jgi:hypothetical protein